MVIDLGLIDFEDAYRIQRELVGRRKLGDAGDSIILAEHHPVFTIGRTGKITNLIADRTALAEKGIRVLDVDRGGDITFHGPGQLVVYPIVDLRIHGRDLHRYMRVLEEAVIGMMGHYSIHAGRIDGKTGVWVSGKKIASIGIAATNWITYHGMSINLNVELEYFSMIHPCGMKDIEMTSAARLSGTGIDMSVAKKNILYHLAGLLNLTKGALEEERYAAVA